MGLTYPADWRFDDEIGPLAPEVVSALIDVIEQVAAQADDPQKVYEVVKSRFGGNGWSSSSSWAQTDMRSLMERNDWNAVAFIDSYWMALAELGKSYAVPSAERVSSVLRKHGSRYAIRAGNLVRESADAQPLAVSAPVPRPDEPDLDWLAPSSLTQMLLNVEAPGLTSQFKGKALEDLMATLFGSVPGLEVKSRVRTETEEIDLFILNHSKEPRFIREGPIFLVECKNWSAKCGKNEFVTFREKLQNRSARASLGFLVSWNGFAETVTKEMLRGSREHILVVPLSGDAIRRAVEGSVFVEELNAAWDAAVQL